MSSNIILLTGSTGFVGQGLIKKLPADSLISIGRKVPETQHGRFVSKTLVASENFTDCLNGVSVVIHAAARVHVMADSSADPLAEYRAINTAGTLNLAVQAAAAGVKRFIFISSIKVNGESTDKGKPFTPFDETAPTDPYGLSKAEAESELRQLAIKTGMEVVVIRPPLVYGPGVKANFAAMLNLAQKNLPLPLGAIHNKRSLVALDNLVDLVITCIDHPKAANQTFLVSDDNDISTPELLQTMTRVAGKKPRLFSVPVDLLKLAALLTGKQAVIDRLCGNLQLDISHTKITLDWIPPVSVEEGIRRCFVKEDLC